MGMGTGTGGSATVRLVGESQSELRFAHPYFAGPLVVAVGAAMLYFAIARLGDGDGGRWILGLAGAFFALVGLGATLWRYELTFDLVSRTYHGRRGFWPAPRELRGSLDELQGVALHHEVRTTSSSKGGSRHHDVFVVRIDFGDWNLRVYESTDLGKSHRKLEHYARLLRASVIDRTGDTETRRAWDELDGSVAERARRSGESVDPPSASPPGDRIAWDPSDGMASVILPPLGFNIGTLVLLLFGLAFAGFGCAVVLALSGIWDVPVQGSRVVGWVVGSLFVVVGLAIMLAGLWGSYAREAVREEQGGLRVYLTMLGRRYRTRFFPKHEIEEVAIKTTRSATSRRSASIRVGGWRIGAPSRSARDAGREVVVRSDAALVTLGNGLGADELAWLEQALRYLAAR